MRSGFFTRRVAHLFAAAMLVGTGMLALVSSARSATWEPFPLPPPPGGEFSTPVGLPGDLSFYAPNRGLMTVGGNLSVPRGVYSWNGRSWHQLATVCGARRIAWAGPTEFWTLADPSPGVVSAGSFCHFSGGAVVGSYGTPNTPAMRQITWTVACRGPSDCWFAGDNGVSDDGSREGAFHLHWDGSGFTPTYAPQGRAVSDLLAFGGGFLESVFAGPGPSSTAEPPLHEAETVPALIHRIEGGAFSNEEWVPTPAGGVPADGTELRALDSDGTTAWAVGGGARSGPGAKAGPVPRLPVAARLEGGVWTDLDVHGAGLQTNEVFGDVAAIPGTLTAWATLTDFDARSDGGPESQPRLAFIAADGEVTVHALAGFGDPIRGAAVRIACPTATDCWMATARGVLYRWGGGSYAVDEEPAFQGTITERPNEGAAQFLPETPPADDSRLFAPPVELPKEQAGLGRCRRPARLMPKVWPPAMAPLAGRRADDSFLLTVRFRLARPARVALIAERRAGARSKGGAAIVARTALRVLRPGSRRLSVTVDRERWPTKLRFVLKEVRKPRCGTRSAPPGSAAG